MSLFQDALDDAMKELEEVDTKLEEMADGGVLTPEERRDWDELLHRQGVLNQRIESLEKLISSSE